MNDERNWLVVKGSRIFAVGQFAVRKRKKPNLIWPNRNQLFFLRRTVQREKNPCTVVLACPWEGAIRCGDIELALCSGTGWEMRRWQKPSQRGFLWLCVQLAMWWQLFLKATCLITPSGDSYQAFLTIGIWKKYIPSCFRSGDIQIMFITFILISWIWGNLLSYVYSNLKQSPGRNSVLEIAPFWQCLVILSSAPCIELVLSLSSDKTSDATGHLRCLEL